jgi:hypothetical protein
MENNLSCFWEEVALSICAKCARSALPEGREARMIDFLTNLFSEFEREWHHRFILGGILNMQNNLWCFWEEVGLSICELLADLLLNFVFEVRENGIIVSFWEVKHGKHYMVFFGLSFCVVLNYSDI